MTNLGLMLSAYIKFHDIEAKRLARDIGICESTLTRIKQGKMPDAEGFAKLMLWLTAPEERK